MGPQPCNGYLKTRGYPGDNPWHDFANATLAAGQPGVNPRDAPLVLLCDGRWKYIHAQGFRPMLFDLERDPDELTDPGASDEATRVAIRALTEARLSDWACRPSQRNTICDARLRAKLQGGFETGLSSAPKRPARCPPIWPPACCTAPGRAHANRF